MSEVKELELIELGEVSAETKGSPGSNPEQSGANCIQGVLSNC